MLMTSCNVLSPKESQGGDLRGDDCQVVASSSAEGQSYAIPLLAIHSRGGEQPKHSLMFVIKSQN